MLNKVLLIGHLGKDPEIRVSQKGTEFATFSLATSERVKKDGKYESVSTWHNIKVFGPQVEFVKKFVNKGTKLWVEGRIENSSYEKDGVKRNSSFIISKTVKTLDKIDNNTTYQQPYGMDF